jgi:NADPH:quinone reductase
MKAIGYIEPHLLDQFALREFTLGEPKLNPTDLLVRIRAVSINPVDYKVRQSRRAGGTEPVILGWDASGVVEKVGSQATGFNVGDKVYYAGDLNRNGSNAELQAVDYRLVALKPKTLSFAEAASLPLTSLTAWEALFERGFVFNGQTNVLIIGGAGGVGSIAIQLLKAETPARVLATASRPDTIEWVKSMGADVVLNHKLPLADEIKKAGCPNVDIVFSTTHTKDYLKIIPDLLRPFGSLCLIDDPEVLDVASFKSKALSVHWEFMFAKSLFGYRMESQGAILKQVAQLADGGKLRPTISETFTGLTVENFKQAHTLIEQGKSIGKTVIEF